MALSNDQITALNFKSFYDQIRPYLNGDAHDAFIPIGSIISIMGNEAPLNFLICDGSTYNIADYPQLASYFTAQFESANYFGGDGVTTFAVPDLQGEFLRGSGTNSHTNQGSGGDVGEHQDGTTIPVGKGAAVGGGQFVFLPVADVDNADKKTGVATNQTANSIDRNSSTEWASTVIARPTNTSVLYCIAYKNVYADMSGLAEAGDGINIDNGVVSTDNMPSSDMSEVASPMPSVMSRRFKYSTEEQVVGEWIDGKPLYQKTVDFGALPNKTSKSVSHGINNLDIMVSMRGCTYTSLHNGISLPDANDTQGTNENTRLYYDNSSVFISCGGIDRSAHSAYITIQYTKTTD